ncbi:MAG: FAD-dependent oxidoreductase [Porticoccaceae bacterium]|jgi:predicted NAD/FAD-binding protein|nr:FAD-dependent oxidoreductase [Porticoccaceae bacterium]MEA3300712.1 FAD-dependent oxidoreductase [Pseudomonadota bacterium]HLS98673.1 FAD-dependent oxidoreductase [Porticoccaceae bacterium]
MKIAVIGTGIAGNVAAWHLSRDHDITVYEANDYVGGHTHTHRVEVEGRVLDVDSGFIVFNDRTYPNFIRLLDELGVDRQKTEMSFSMHAEATGFEYSGSNLDTLFAQRRNLLNPAFYRLLADILRFNREAQGLLASDDSALTLGEFLRDGRYGEGFTRHYILPMGAAIWSTSLDLMLDFPATFFARFFHNHGLLSINDRPQWYVVKGGSRAYVEAMTRRYRERIRLSSPVTRVRRFADRVEVEANGQLDTYQAVFFACHSDQALAMIDDATALEKAVLGAFPYQRNSALLHSGTELLPDRPRAWASWNYRLPRDDAGKATLTYYMNRLQSLPCREHLCVTLNNDAAVPADKVIAAMSYDHPLFTRASVAAQARQVEINGLRRSFFCGAYWRNGFHEDGVVSALNALDHFRLWEESIGYLPLHRTG